MSRALDTRRVADVRPKRAPTLAEFYDDPELLRLGYNGDPKVMPLRIRRIAELEVEGRGPGAQFHADLRACGYTRRPAWPVLDFAWNESPTPAWTVALAAAKNPPRRRPRG